jgi:hypothetical protein
LDSGFETHVSTACHKPEFTIQIEDEQPLPPLCTIRMLQILIPHLAQVFSGSSSFATDFVVHGILLNNLVPLETNMWQ